MTIINGHKWTFLFNSQRYLSGVNYIRREDTLFNGLSVTYINNLKGKTNLKKKKKAAGSMYA